MKRLGLALGIALAGLGWSGSAFAQGASGAAGLVLEASGTIMPAVKPYTEIAGGTTLVLGGSGKIVFAHYQTCKTVTVVGGTVTVQPTSYAARDGKQSEVATPCPRKVNVRGGGELGGVVFRSAAPRRSLTLQLEPAFVLVGSRAGEFATARIGRDDATIVEGPINDHVFRWPSGVNPLAPNSAFELTLLPKASGDRPVTTRFSTPVAADPVGQEPLVVISVD
jgi:hypothetical protein